jgi:small subunit ribosomal protein S20
MNKKQRNRKLINQNKRNRIVNRRYTSTIKTLSKLLKGKVKDKNLNTKEESILLLNNLYSMIDKAAKKGVIHKNTAARKKSKFGVLISNL